MRLSRSPRAPSTIGFWLSRSTRMVASIRRSLALFLEAVDHHLAAVGAPWPISSKIFSRRSSAAKKRSSRSVSWSPVRGRRLGQRLAQRVEQLADVLPVFALTGTMAAKSRVFDQAIEERYEPTHA